MTVNNVENIPPIIQDWVKNMNLVGVQAHVNQNYYSMLDNVMKYIQSELKRYDTARIRNDSFKPIKRKR